MPDRKTYSARFRDIYDNRRKHARLEKHLPIEILGIGDASNVYNELAETLDVSATGIRLLLNSQVKVGERVVISTNQPELKAHLAVFEVRSAGKMRKLLSDRRQLDTPSYKWQLGFE